jgi:predicted amidohydrolase YtcJ
MPLRSCIHICFPASRARAALLAVALLGGCEAPDHPDTVYYNGAVYTMTAEHARVSAVAVRDGAILYAGDDAAAQALAGPETVRVDLAGRMMLPGFHDTHAHVLAGGISLYGCNLDDVRDGERILAMLPGCLAEYRYAEDAWVIGSRWGLAAFAGGNPRKEWLDAVFGARPAYFVDSFSHSAWVSSKALEIAGISAHTPDPPHGVIERDPVTGEPTGTLRDTAMELDAAHIPPATAEEIAAGITRGQQEAARFGITAYIEPGLNAQQARIYRQLDSDGRLGARVQGSLSPLGWSAGEVGEGLFELVDELGSLAGERFRTGSVKIYIDGVIETRTSHLLQPYDDHSNFPPFYDRESLYSIYERLHAQGVQIHTHAIGDGAIRLALDAYERARDRSGPLDNRHHIVHLQLIDPADIPRFGQLGVAAGFQGLWAYPDEYIDVAVPLVGAERAGRFYPVASVQRSGGLIVGGSDWDVSSLNPLDAIEALVRRQDPFSDDGPALAPAEAIDLESALRAYTANAAYLMKLETFSGTIEAGKRADLVVLDRDLFAIETTAINEARVLLTLIDGQAVWRAPEF